MDTVARIESWRQIAIAALRAAGKDSDAAALEGESWTKSDDLFAYFDCFRPDGKGVENVFAGVVRGKEILERLLRVFESTKGSYQRFLYFIVCSPPRVDDARLVELTRLHYDSMREIARAFRCERRNIFPIHESVLNGADRLAVILDKGFAVDIKRELYLSGKIDVSAPETLAYDIAGDWFQTLMPEQSAALLLDEAFYSMACDYDIVRYLLWPLYAGSTEIVDPFAAAFELWTCGARAVFEKPGLVKLYVAGDL